MVLEKDMGRDFLLAMMEQEDLTQQIFYGPGQVKSLLISGHRCLMISGLRHVLVVTGGFGIGTGLGMRKLKRVVV